MELFFSDLQYPLTNNKFILLFKINYLKSDILFKLQDRAPNPKGQLKHWIEEFKKLKEFIQG